MSITTPPAQPVTPTLQRLEQALRQAAQEAGVQLPSPLEGTLDTVMAQAQEAGLGQEELGQAYAQAFRLPYRPSLGGGVASSRFLERIPIAFARQHQVLGLIGEAGQTGGADEASKMPVAVGDWGKLDVLDVLARFLEQPVEPVLCPADEVAKAIDQAYQKRTGQAEHFIQKLDRQSVLEQVDQMGTREDLLDVAGRAPVIQLVNLILFEAVKAEASDVHVQPYEDRLMVRLRLDGVLIDAFTLPKALQEEVISRVKVIGRMNIAEKRLAQDGRATVQVGDRMIDLRIASLPTSFGERVVVRLLDKSARLYTLNDLGMDPQTMRHFRRLIVMEHGLVLVTGPTGSGKSTTLYGALQEIDRQQHNILTLEDPIEYQLDGVSQTQVNQRKGMTFASGLRSVLRQDPDIIMVGEIRDHDTAVMAIQSALTGHLVFSTLHTNDAPSAVTRLLDLGIEPYLVASSLMGVLAQRLVRKVCPKCGQEDPQGRTRIEELGAHTHQVVPQDAKVLQAQGCEACRQLGYKGRIGIFELLVVDDGVRGQVQDRRNASQIRQDGIQRGMRTLRQDGLEKVLRGITTTDEVIRVTAQ